MNNKVSIIVPVYNSEKWLENTLDAILRQTYSSYELILIDDGSTDGSGGICDRFAREHHQVKVIRQSNGGVSAARNAGLDCAGGEYVLFVDADDIIADDMVETLVGLMESRRADMSLVNVRKIPDASLAEQAAASQGVCEFDNAGFVKEILRIKLFDIGSCAKLFKRELIGGIRFEADKNINEDIYFLIQYALKVRSAVFDRVDKYFYLTHRQSASNARFNDDYGAMLYYADKIEATVTAQYDDALAYYACLYKMCIYELFLNVLIYSGGKTHFPKAYEEIRRRISAYMPKVNRLGVLKYRLLFRLFLMSPSLYTAMLRVYKGKNFNRGKNHHG